MRELPGTARTRAEIDFVVGLESCAVCGRRRVALQSLARASDRWLVRGACGHCSATVELMVAGGRLETEPGPLELGGMLPSTMLAPVDLVTEVDRLVTQPDDAVAIARARTALNELAKFVAPGSALVTTDDRSRDDARARPERYTRAWIVAEQARWAAAAAAVAVAEARGAIDREAVAAHRGWLAQLNGVVWPRGTPAHRLDAVGLDGTGRMIASADLSGCRLERVKLVRADLRNSRLDRADLIDVDFGHADLTGASLAAVTSDACRFVKARLDRSHWHDAVVVDADFRDAHLVAAELDGTQLVRCDLRNVSLARGSAVATTFVECDLRGADLGALALAGAQLIDCRVAGAHGAPGAFDGWVVERADFSLTGDGTDLGDADDLLDALAGG